MLDQDDSGRIDKMEFQVLETIFTAAAKVMCYLLRGIAIQSDYLQERMQEDDDNGLMKHQGVDTSILLHLFGRDGAGELEFEQFCTFMNNLQTEVIQIKLAEVSKGAPTITELDFARILLRYTFLNCQDYDNILERLQERIQEEKGITFEEFKDLSLHVPEQSVRLSDRHEDIHTR